MQDEGVIAPDEPFMYFSIFDTTPDGRLGPSFALDQEARLAMFEMTKRGEAPRHVPEQITVDAYRSDTRLELIESFALFELNQERFIAGRAGVRNFGHFGGVSASELAKDLALADAGERLLRYRQGRYQPFGLKDLKRLRDKTEGWGREGSPCSDLPFPAFSVGGAPETWLDYVELGFKAPAAAEAGKQVTLKVQVTSTGDTPISGPWPRPRAESRWSRRIAPVAAEPQ
jgi:hypothetical protein